MNEELLFYYFMSFNASIRQTVDEFYYWVGESLDLERKIRHGRN